MASGPDRLPAAKGALLRRGTVIPAHPLALQADLRLDVRRQADLTRYYLDSGAGGVAVGVHTTQFAIRAPAVGLYEPVLELAAATARDWAGEAARRPAPLLVAGVMGPTAQAVAEAETARALGYDLAMVIATGWGAAPDAEILAGVRAVGEVLPVFGFYLQPALGRRRFGPRFWREYAEIPAVAAIKAAPFDRYATIDVVRGIVDAGRAADVALYTGNDDTIVTDLLTPFHHAGERVEVVGGLLGQFACWTAAAVRLHARIRALVGTGSAVPPDLLRLGAALTDANGAIFDVAHGFAGSIAGIHEVLRREGRMAGTWCLEDHERLSPGQLDEIDRVMAAYPELRDPGGSAAG